MKKVNLLLLWAFVLAGLQSCTMGVVDYRTDEGKVIIRPDWSGYDLPAGTKFYFYNTDGKSAPVEADGSAEGYVGMLPSGTYKMVAYNTDATQVEFQSMEKYETASVHALPNTRRSVTRDGDVRCILQPSQLFSLALGDVEVEYLSTTEREVKPLPLTKTIRLEFKLTGDGVADAKKISGEICGVYPTLLLATGQPTPESINNCPNTTTAFDITLADNQGTAEIKVFGLHDPEGGNNYENRLTLAVTDKNNNIRNAEIDLSDVISDVIDKNGGTIPVEIPIEIQVEVSLKDAELKVSAKPWVEDTGSGEI